MNQDIIDKLPPDVQKEYMKMAIKLSEKEKQLLANEKPWGLILFKRNIKSLKQIKKLVMAK